MQLPSIIKRPKILQILLSIYFLFGLHNITHPPLDDHAWRQTLTISVAKNLVDHPNPMFPRMDIGGDTEGIIAGEFPAFNSLMSLCYRVFGYDHWYGRLINWSIGCLGLWYFYLLIKIYFVLLRKTQVQ